ncbi:probable plastid-lipid-associated protein 13, chloroplastic [Salvia hispanica]|uniref:probable plastid-lipid-associated protein 13, chloroplastic n=1 Tax=Salvia hispanica TaxID=49212 RepID=UPI002009BE7D|nr:probable plastid-lipid-associated protein 13, chloroplastic [Salvia hispanica]XP_047961178.1 probable plastid-lipid-associated protein 13, chloroplastic [Salvia hispanica]
MWLFISCSPFLRGKWNIEWFGSGSPGLLAARILFERFPPALTSSLNLDAVINDGYANVSADKEQIYCLHPAICQGAT